VLACLDVDYRADSAVAACVVLGDWADATPLVEHSVRVPGPPAEYVPGEFFRRELPPLLAVLRTLVLPAPDGSGEPAIVLVDGYVSLGGRPGLGQHLHEALGGRVAVVGVAKTHFRSASDALPVCRGTSARPLYVSAVGLDVAEAARGVTRMAGPFRLPAMLLRVDRLSRTAQP
jgi:deoxyribonuclease V